MGTHRPLVGLLFGKATLENNLPRPRKLKVCILFNPAILPYFLKGTYPRNVPIQCAKTHGH